MLLRIVELGMALYYGKMKKATNRNGQADLNGKTEHSNMSEESHGDDSGWVSWAWNTLLGEEEDEQHVHAVGSSGKGCDVLVVIVWVKTEKRCLKRIN